MAILSRPSSALSLSSSALNVSAEDHLFFANELQETLDDNLNDFIQELHKLNVISVYFNNLKLYFEYVQRCLLGSTEIVSLIFAKPDAFTETIYKKKLAHRLSLFIFYWGARFPPHPGTLKLHEPLRAIVITRPRKKA